ncbi:MAG: sulfite exporter TauE/SafE family protein [Tepidisphaeraceae bacterium]
MTNPVTLILLGVIVGVFSGVMGLGGGSVMIPMMVLLLGMTQTQAHGTSLAVMVPPVTIPAVIAYYLARDPDSGRRNVDLRVAIFMAIGVAMGTYFGARVANHLPKEALKLVFGFVLIYIASYTVLGKQNLARTLVLSVLIVLFAVAVFTATKWHDRSRSSPHASAVPDIRP